LLVTVHAEEGINLDDYFGEDEENLYDDDEQDDDVEPSAPTDLQALVADDVTLAVPVAYRRASGGPNGGFQIGVSVGPYSHQLLLNKSLACDGTGLLMYRKGPLKGSIERHDRQKVIVSEVGQELLQGQEDIGELVAIIHGA
jgi:hypothetical protein